MNAVPVESDDEVEKTGNVICAYVFVLDSDFVMMETF